MTPEGAGAVFMDRAEALGLKSILEIFASHFAGRDGGGSIRKRMCLCAAATYNHGRQQESRISDVLHDMTCPCHRIVVLCGDEEDKEALRARAFTFASLCVAIDKTPDVHTYADVTFARAILGKEWLVDEDGNPMVVTP